MAAKYSVETEITGRGNLAEVARRATSALRGMLGPINAVNAAVQKPETTALGRVGNVADHVAGRFRSGLGSITAWLPALGALGAAASFGGLVALTRRAAEGFDGMSTKAEQLGTTMSQLSVLRYGWKLNNIEIEQGEKGLGKLNRTLYDAATGKNKDAAALFQRLGISVRDANGQVRKGVDVLPQLMQAFERNENPALRAAMATALFGKAGEALIPFLIRGRSYLEALGEENRRYSSLTDAQRKSLGELDNAYDRLDKAGSGLSTRLAASLAPALGRVVDDTTNWIVANRELIGQAMDRKVEGLERVVTGLARAAKRFLDLPLISSLKEGADAGTLFDIGLAALGLTMTGPLLAAVGVVTKAVWALNKAVLLNPWVFLIAAIGVAAYAVYENWGPITDWFDEQMDGISAAMDRGFGSGLVEILKRSDPFEIVKDGAQGLYRWLNGVDMSPAGRAMMDSLVSGLTAGLPSFRKVWSVIEAGMDWVDRNKSGGTAQAAAMSLAGEFGGLGGPMPALAAPSPTAGAVAAQRSEVVVKVDLGNLPPGTRHDVQTTGPAKVETNVGYSMVPGNL